jgi:hypothetical protein
MDDIPESKSKSWFMDSTLFVFVRVFKKSDRVLLIKTAREKLLKFWYPAWSKVKVSDKELLHKCYFYTNCHC